MGNEADGNEKKKILTNKSSFNQSNCREIQDSDSENISRENLKKEISKHSIPNSNDEEEYEADEEKSKNQINNDNEETNYIEHTFIWKEGGTNVKLVGSFNNWKQQIIMTKELNDNCFKYKIKLKRDKYEYKFIVDNVWKFSRQQGMKSDGKGNTNNFIDLTDNKITQNGIKKIKKKKKKAKKVEQEEQEIIKEEGFGVLLPQKEDLNTDPPNTQELFLQSFPINEATNQKNVGEGKYFHYINRESFTEEKSYRNLLYSPHVNLNHTLTFCEQKNILQVGLTYRFRNKDCTMIYYSRL